MKYKQFTIPNKTMNWNLPDPIEFNENTASSMDKILSFFSELIINDSNCNEWTKIPMCDVNIQIIVDSIYNGKPTKWVKHKIYKLPEMVFTTEGLTVAQYRNTFKYKYKMIPPYESELLEHILWAMQSLIAHNRNLSKEFMEYFNTQYKRYQKKLKKKKYKWYTAGGDSINSHRSSHIK